LKAGKPEVGDQRSPSAFDICIFLHRYALRRSATPNLRNANQSLYRGRCKNGDEDGQAACFC
jgi:hypothetical protein